MGSGQINVNLIVGQSFLFPVSIQSGKPFSYEFLTLKCPILTDIISRSYGKTNHKNPEIVLY